mmetsp:Transcript_10586/g.15867  ORF Transcript_10586/g.15867 Transcript_10586/m.15867 type:complete len:89 (+) Transcript_10586:61-327(+)
MSAALSAADKNFDNEIKRRFYDQEAIKHQAKKIDELTRENSSLRQKYLGLKTDSSDIITLLKTQIEDKDKSIEQLNEENKKISDRTQR